MRHKIVLLAVVTSLALPGQIPDFTPPTPLFSAVLSNDTRSVKKLLAEGADPNEGRFFGSTALLFAIINSNQPAIRAMVASGADFKATDRHGSTTLMWAVGSESPDPALVEELLKRGVDPNTLNKLGESALTWAIRRGNMSMVERLKAAGASDASAVRHSVQNAVSLLQKSGPEFIRLRVMPSSISAANGICRCARPRFPC